MLCVELAVEEREKENVEVPEVLGGMGGGIAPKFGMKLGGPWPPGPLGMLPGGGAPGGGAPGMLNDGGIGGKPKSCLGGPPPTCPRGGISDMTPGKKITTMIINYVRMLAHTHYCSFAVCGEFSKDPPSSS